MIVEVLCAVVGVVVNTAADFFLSKLCSSDKKQDVFKILQENTRSVKVIDNGSERQWVKPQHN